MIQHCTNYQFQMQCSKISLTQQAPRLLFKKNEGWYDPSIVQFCRLFRLCKLLLPQTVFYTFLYSFEVAMTMLTIIRFILLYCEVVLYMPLFTCFLLIKVHFILLPFSKNCSSFILFNLIFVMVKNHVDIFPNLNWLIINIYISLYFKKKSSSYWWC